MLIIAVPSVRGQTHVVQREFYDLEDGLSHREVNAIYQCSRGLIWIGTRNGLNWFDGYQFRWASKKDYGFSFNNIISIGEDTEGYIWMMGPWEETYIDLFHPITGEVISFHDKFDIPASELGSGIHTGADRSIFLNTREGTSILHYRPETGIKQILLSELAPVSILQISTQNTIWIDSGSRMIAEIDTLGNVLQVFHHEDPMRFQGFFPSGSGFFYKTIDPATKQESVFQIDAFGQQSRVPDTAMPGRELEVFDFMFPTNFPDIHWRQGKLFREDQGMITDFREINNRDLWGHLRAYLPDRNGNIWMGGNFGLYSISIQENRFEQFLVDSLSYQLNRTSYRGLSVFDNKLFAVNEYSGLHYVDLRTGEEVELPYDTSLWGHYGIFSLPDGRILVGANKGVYVFDSESEGYQFVKNNYGPAIWYFFPLSATRLLMGCGLGLLELDLETMQILPFEKYNEYSSLARARVLHIERDRSGRIWICTEKGLYQFDSEKGVINRYWSGGDEAHYFPEDIIYHFYEDAEGVFWLGTGGGGLLRWEPERNQVKQYTRTDGLPNEVIYSVYEDNYNHLWMSSDYGIIQFDKTSGQARAYLPKDGITHQEFNRLSHYRDRQGNLYFGGLKGVTSFHPEDFYRPKKKADQPQLVVTSFVQFDGEQNRLLDRTTNLLNTNQIQFRPNDRYLQLEVSLLTFQDVKNIQYAFRITEVDQGWNYQREPVIRLGRLPYGTHTLVVKGQAADGQWSEDMLAIELVVLSPFYLQFWFLALVVLLLILFVIGFIRWRIWEYKVNERRLQLAVKQQTRRITQDKMTIEEQAAELEEKAYKLQELDKVKSQFFTNISHELRTPLTLILGPLQTLTKRGDLDDRDFGLLYTARQNAKHLLRLVNEMLDFAKLEAGKIKVENHPCHLALLLRKILSNYESYAQQKGVYLNYEGEALSARVFLLDQNKLEKILHNLFSNAIKFTPKGGRVAINLWEEEHKLCISVQDDGPGIDEKDLPHIFDRFYRAEHVESSPGGSGIGLAMSKEFAELMGGSLEVHSELGAGSLFTCYLPKREVEDLSSYAQEQQTESAESDWRELGASSVSDQEKPVQHISGLPSLLVVEDNAELSNYLEMLLSEKYQVTSVANGQEAWSVLEKEWAAAELKMNEQRIRLVISDVMMPVMDGLTLLGKIKKHPQGRQLPVLLLTARGSLQDKLNALHIGVDDYVVKPFEEEELMARIHNLLLHDLWRQEEDYSQGLAKEEKLGRADHEWLKEVESLVQEQILQGEVSVTMLSQQLTVSERQLQRRLKQLTGLSPVQYIREVRLQRARRLLENGTFKTVSEVCFAVGFSNPSYFARLYKAEFGRQPSDYFN